MQGATAPLPPVDGCRPERTVSNENYPGPEGRAAQDSREAPQGPATGSRGPALRRRPAQNQTATRTPAIATQAAGWVTR